MPWLRRLLFILIVQGLSAPAAAHSRSTSYSIWDLSGTAENVSLRARLDEIDLTRLNLHPDYTLGYETAVLDLLQSDLQLRRGDQLCGWDSEADLRRIAGQLVIEARLVCPATGAYAITSRLLLEPLPSHLHFAQIIGPDNKRLERVLTSDLNNWALASDAFSSGETPSSVGGFWRLGVEHILSGWDHLAFVLGLILLAATVGQVAWLVTGFTLAHSITLALAVLGLVKPDEATVEALIALSIVLIAVEAGWQLTARPRWLPKAAVISLLALAACQPSGLPVVALLGMALFCFCYFNLLEQVQRPHRVRALIAFAFGLFHGFGFAGVLAEMQLPATNRAAALFGFNLGVESGQLLVVLLLWPILRWAGSVKQALPSWLTAGLAGLGTYWLVVRAFT